jgi:hypothetical protein
MLHHLKLGICCINPMSGLREDSVDVVGSYISQGFIGSGMSELPFMSSLFRLADKINQHQQA